MAEIRSESQSDSTIGVVGQIAWRLVTAMVVLAITAFFTPGFSINNFWTLAISAIVLTVIDYIISKFTNMSVNSFGKGILGFVLAAATLYITQFFVAGYTISWMAAIIGALIYGVVDYFIPGEQ